MKTPRLVKTANMYMQHSSWLPTDPRNDLKARNKNDHDMVIVYKNEILDHGITEIGDNCCLFTQTPLKPSQHWHQVYLWDFRSHGWKCYADSRMIGKHPRKT